MKTIQDIAKELHKINFGTDGIIITQFKNGDYTYKDDWKGSNEEGSHKHTDIDNCCCDLCNKYNACVLEDDYKDEHKHYQFTNVSHGTHMFDFLQAHGADISKVDGWSTKPVMFVMENPSNGKNNDYAKIKNLAHKRPSKSWYWLNSSYDEHDDKFKYPNFFTQGEYGKLVYSIMNTFKIANGYLTNMVKCGVGCYDEQGNDSYTTTEKYNHQIVRDCIEQRLKNELNTLRRDANDTVIVFAFALNTFNYLNEYLKDEIENEKVKICLLPHPANRLANDYRKYVLFGKIARALKLNNFYEGIDEIDYMAILTSDEDKIPDLKLNIKELSEFIKNIKNADISQISESLKVFVEEIKGVICHNTYNCGKLTYTINTVNGGLVKDFTLMYKAPRNKTLEGGKYKVIWVNYNFVDDYIETWLGKDNSANERVEIGMAEEFNLYGLMVFIVNKFKQKKN